MPVKDPHVVYLDLALESLKAQSSPNWSLLIVVEPDELDALSALLAPWTADPRATILANEGKRLAGAVNTAMRHATTDFVALLLADDLWETDAVFALDEHIRRHPDVDFFHSGRRIVDDEGKPISSVHLPTTGVITAADFADRAPVKHLLCWRRAMGLQVGGLDERFHSVGPDDFDFPWTMADAGARFLAIPMGLYVYRDHRSNARLTTHIPRRMHVRVHRQVFRKHGLPWRQRRRRMREARRTYLRQSLHRSSFEARLFAKLGRKPRAWRDSYR